jgi:colanic acid/amylovoran biosynthesis protein
MDDHVKQYELLFKEGKIEEAENFFISHLEKNPEHVEVLNNLGVIHYSKGNLKIAEDFFTKAISTQNDYLDAILNLANLYQNEKRWKDAACQLEKCILICSDDPNLYNQLAMNYMEYGDLENARNVIIKSLELGPEQIDIQELLSAIEGKLCSLNKNICSNAVKHSEFKISNINILIRGGGFVNKGAETMVKTVKNEMSKRLPDAKFFIEVTPSMEKFVESQGFIPIIENTNARYSILDGIIDVSGFALGDEWGVKNSQFYQYHNSIFESFGKPIVFLPQAWGPFTNKSIRKFSASAINLSDCAYARDKRSYFYINELEGIDRNKIKLAPDIAFHFEGASKEQAINILKENGLISTEKNMVGIMPNMQVYLRTNGKGHENKYVKMLIDLARYFLKTQNFTVVLIPHQVQPSKNSEISDDRVLCDLIKVSLGNIPDVVALTDYYSAEILKAIIGNMNLVIGSRYHGIIAALSQMIPTLVLGWSHKYFELLSDVGIEQYIADHKNLNKDELLALAEKVWFNCKELSNTLKQKVPEQVYNSAGALDHTASIFADRYLS